MRMMGDSSIAIIAAAPVKVRNRDAEYPYRQDSDFLYLTSFPEPEAVAVLIPGRPQGQYILFCRENDPVRETWSGRRAGLTGAVQQYGADDAFPISNLDEILPGLLEQRERVFYTMGRDVSFDQRLMGWVNRLRDQARSGTQPPYQFITLEHALHELRLFKTPTELNHMRRAAKVAVDAHLRAMRTCQPGMNECEVEAELVYEFRRAGCQASYSPIVGGGANGCILHYVENNAPLKDGDLLLIDAGAEHQGYASDITRTFPVGGRFTPPQRELYELVLEAQRAAIEKAKPGNRWNDPHDAAVRVLTKGMVELGLLKGRANQLIRDGEYRKYYMHRTGHWLGLDVHDVGDYKVDEDWRMLEPGMVLTVEPGLYISATTKGAPKRYWDTGIRIEDDVLITADGNEVLTEAAIKEPDAIEQYMSAQAEH